jgi:hypothetical protein
VRKLFLSLVCLLGVALSVRAAEVVVTETVESDQPGNPWRYTPGEGWWRWKLPTGALAEVNATRAARGLPPYVEDPGLTAAAQGAADFRAAHLIAGHTANDFAYVPSGSSASAAGCAAWEPSMGWGSCCTYEQWTYAGAAWSLGSDGRRYMHLFVR